MTRDEMFKIIREAKIEDEELSQRLNAMVRSKVNEINDECQRAGGNPLDAIHVALGTAAPPLCAVDDALSDTEKALASLTLAAVLARHYPKARPERVAKVVLTMTGGYDVPARIAAGLMNLHLFDEYLDYGDNCSLHSHPATVQFLPGDKPVVSVRVPEAGSSTFAHIYMVPVGE